MENTLPLSVVSKITQKVLRDADMELIHKIGAIGQDLKSYQRKVAKFRREAV